MKHFIMTSLILFLFTSLALTDALGQTFDGPVGSTGVSDFEIDALGKSLRDARSFQTNARTGGKNCSISTPVIKLQILELRNESGKSNVTIYGLGSGYAISGWNTSSLEVRQVRGATIAERGVPSHVKAKIDLSTCNVCVKTSEMKTPSCR